MSKYVITFGEIMMRLSATGFNRFTQAESLRVTYGGAEANVSISLSKLGLAASHVTRLPANDLGKSVLEHLHRHGIDTSFIQKGNERLGLYFLENGSMHRAPKIIYDRFNSAFASITADQFDWDQILKDASWFHWTGITPAISQGAAGASLKAIQAARKHRVPVSGDINYRRNLWQYGKSATDVMPALIDGTQYLVAGTTDMANCLGIESDDFTSACRLVMKSFPGIKKIANTNRQTISASHNRIYGIVWNGKELIRSCAYDLTHIVDRVGAGDAYMAGLIYGWINGYDDQQTVNFATAASALKHSIEGDANIASVQEIEMLVRNENTGKLLR